MFDWLTPRHRHHWRRTGREWKLLNPEDKIQLGIVVEQECITCGKIEFARFTV